MRGALAFTFNWPFPGALSLPVQRTHHRGKTDSERRPPRACERVVDQESREIWVYHILALHGDDLLHETVAAMHDHGTIEHTSKSIHVHPTLSETVKFAARAAR
jgi:pyruvate/2-oxoglutarate dehydrogenase complex dihydrolipoamide dehydrogenase (E3) component